MKKKTPRWPIRRKANTVVEGLLVEGQQMPSGLRGVRSHRLLGRLI
jgi:hypothetical protein